MKKILLILSLFPILVFSQKSYKIPADSTILNNIGSGKNELVIRNATSNITGGILTNLGNGVTAFVLGGGSARVVDTIYKNTAKDSIVFTISGIRYAVKDSIGVTDLSGYALQSSLNDTASTLRRIRKVDSSYLFKNATRDSICMVTVINGSTYRTCAFDSSNVNTDSQSLHLAFDDSITLSITRGNYIKFAYAVDSVGLNAGGDSIVVIKAGLRKGYAIGSSGGGSLSSLTAATATNTINNGNLQQQWQWNSLANNTGFKLSSTSGGSLNTTNKLFECELTGAMPGTGNSSYAGYFKNTQTLGGAVGTGLYAEGGGSAGVSILANGSINIQNGSLQLGGSLGGLFYRSAGNTYLQASTGQQLTLVSQDATAGNIDFLCSQGSSDVGFQIAKRTLNQHYVFGLGGARIIFGNYFSGSSTSACLMERNANKIIFSANSGLPGGIAIYVPNNILTINGGATEATSNVGIGTTSPVASAKLEVSSTTSGFLPPRMTATQASAISTPAQGLLLFVSDTNGTFTSVGWWGYNGSTWEKLNN